MLHCASLLDLNVGSRHMTKGQHFCEWHMICFWVTVQPPMHTSSVSILQVRLWYGFRLVPSCLSRLLTCLSTTLWCQNRYENVQDKVESADSAMSGLAQLSLGAPPPHCRDPLKDTPLAELLFPALPSSLHASSQVQDVLLVLKILECLNR